MKKCKYCFSEIDEKATICPVCKKKQKNNKNAILTILQIIVVLFVLGCLCIGGYIIFNLFNVKDDYKDFAEYKILNVHELQKAYLENEIVAKDTYQNNYYYFDGEISKIENNLSDNEITLHYHYEYDSTKQMSVYTHFSKNEENIKSLKTGDKITVYCKFSDRIIDNYLGVTSGYKFTDCRIK